MTIHGFPFNPDPPPGLGTDQVIRWFASRQYDAVGRAQLMAQGVSRHEIDGRIARGVLRRIHRGVLALGAAELSPKGRFFAALLGAPRGSVLSHRSAAALWGLLPDTPGPVEITTVGPAAGRLGVVVHRSISVAATSTVRDRIPCTNLPRTLVDNARNPVVARRAWATLAGRRGLVPGAIEDELRHHPARPGSVSIRALLEEHRQTVAGHTRSENEAAAITMCVAHDLPMPRVNSLVRTNGGAYEADLLWSDERLIVEIDDWGTHGSAHAFRADRHRDFDLELAGWTVVRLLGTDVRRHAAANAERLRRRLEQRSPLRASS